MHKDHAIGCPRANDVRAAPTADAVEASTLPMRSREPLPEAGEADSTTYWSSMRSNTHLVNEDVHGDQEIVNDHCQNTPWTPEEQQRPLQSSPELPTKISLTSLAPFNYQLALQNRTLNDKLLPGRSFDTHMYTPTFVHDCLMIPGTLATVLGKGSSEDLIRRMTPAILRGFRAAVDAQTSLPILVPSDKVGDYVQGMLVFGQGSRARGRINRHYGPRSRQVKLDVEFDVVQFVGYREDGSQIVSLERREVRAKVWVCDDASSSGSGSLSEEFGWDLEGYLKGEF